MTKWKETYEGDRWHPTYIELQGEETMYRIYRLSKLDKPYHLTKGNYDVLIGQFYDLDTAKRVGEAIVTGRLK